MTLMTAKSSFECFEGIFFDLDGTLVNLHIQWDMVRADMRKAFNTACACDLPESGISRLIEYASVHGCRHTRKIAAEILFKYESSAWFDPLPDGISLFRFILNNKKIAVISNNLHSTAERVLRSLGLFNPTIYICGFDDVAHSKPNPEGIMLALRKLAVEQGRVIMVGDKMSDRDAACNAQVQFYHISALDRY
jgi:phosphoglycolate phosphatase